MFMSPISLKITEMLNQEEDILDRVLFQESVTQKIQHLLNFLNQKGAVRQEFQRITKQNVMS